MRNLILSAFADEYDSDFETQLQALTDFGIEYMEIRFVNGKNVSLLTSEERSHVQRLLEKYAVKINSIGSPIGKIALDGDMEAHREMSRNVFEIANVLGARFVRLFSFYPPKGTRIADCRKEVLSELEKLISIADSYGVTLCHENEGEIYGESPEACLDLFTYFNGRLKAVFDMGNFRAGGYDPIRAYAMLKSHIAYFHIKDANTDGAIVPPGMGAAKIKEILTDYSTYASTPTFITLEPHLQDFAGLNDLTATKLNLPYRYESPQAAFSDAVKKIKEILKC